MDKIFKVVILFVFLGFGAMLSGCSGGGAEVQTHTRTTTLGQELMDLEKAYKQGVITEEQYNASKKDLLEKE